MYLQKCEEYDGNQTYGVDNNGNLHKGIVCFMIVGLKENVSYVIHSVPQSKISGDLLKVELEKCLEILQDIKFRVRAVVSDNHASNVAAYNSLLKDYGRDNDILRIWFNDQPIYLCYDAVHLVKNLRNNLQIRKQLLFPPFVCDAMDQKLKIAGGAISWSLLHRVHEEDRKNESNLRAAPKLTTTALHPGNCKQSVPVALAIFDPSTRAAILKYFPNAQDSADFIHLIYTWWTISNSKFRYNSNNKIGHAAVVGDGKPEFLRMLADWFQEWKEETIPNAQKFTLSAQTNKAMIQTLRCHASLIEDLLLEGYDYVLTARFQTDRLERRYGQYRQMSGGRFLVSARDVSNSENILKIKSLVKAGFDITEDLKINNDYSEERNTLLINAESVIKDENSLKLDESSKDISNYVAGYIAHKSSKAYQNCCGNRMISNSQELPSASFTSILSRGGLKAAPEDLNDAVAKSFAILDASCTVIRCSKVPSMQAAFSILEKFVDLPTLSCENHRIVFTRRVYRAICNCFFTAQRKRSAESVADDHVRAFKKSKRNKDD